MIVSSPSRLIISRVEPTGFRCPSLVFCEIFRGSIDLKVDVPDRDEKEGSHLPRFSSRRFCAQLVRGGHADRSRAVECLERDWDTTAQPVAHDVKLLRGALSFANNGLCVVCCLLLLLLV